MACSRNHDLPSLSIACSPARNYEGDIFGLRPFGASSAKNTLEHFLGTPDIVNHVLYLGCGDLRNALFTVSKLTIAYPELEIHLCDNSDVIMTRNFVIANIMLSETFDPSNTADLDYLWNLWYSLQWTESTRRRFVKDLKQLLLAQRSWNTDNLTIPETKAQEHMKQIFRCWLNTACNMTASSINEKLEQRLNFTKRFACSDEKVNERWSEASLQENASESEVVTAVRKRIHSLTCFGSQLPNSLDKEIEHFVKTGNCEPITEKTVCLNPTLLTPQLEISCVNYLTSPFEAYFPVSLEDQIASASLFELNGGKNAVSYCKSKLQSLVFLLRSRRTRVKFYFHFGDCLELCFRDTNLQNKFQVVHCSDLVDHDGLANLLLAASLCLSNNYPEAALLIDTVSWIGLKRPKVPECVQTIAEFIELSLCCPLSMIPTIYGVKLKNHVQLGSPVCIKLHDSISVNSVTLKWIKAPAYSSNVYLDMSPTLVQAFALLSEACFVFQQKENSECASLPYSPLTFYYTLRSLVNRSKWFPGAIDTLVQKTVVPSILNLEWRTQQEWMKGQPVFLYSSQSPSVLRDVILRGLNFPLVTCILVSKEEIKRHKAKVGIRLPKAFFSNVHVIENLFWTKAKSGLTFIDTKLFADPPLSLLLSQDHGLSVSTQLCFVDALSSTMLHSVDFFKLFKSKVIVNPTPILGPSLQATPQHTVKCIEFDDRYTLNCTFGRKKPINIKDLVVSSEAFHPSVSTHKLNLTLPNGSTLIVEVPWPVLADGIDAILNQDNSIQLVLKKSLNDAWPEEFVGRSKWDVDLLKHWKEVEGSGKIKDHVVAQFNCNALFLERRFWKDRLYPVLDDVREIVRAIFYSHFNNSFLLFTIYSYQDQRTPVFHLRIRPPVRCSPQGAPLLLLSIIDCRLAQQLIAKGKLDPEQYNFDYHRIFTERVSMQVCSIFSTSTAEEDLLRYLLRVNSTRMRRGAWQSKNLPRGDNSPWMPTFLCPVYRENLNHCCSGPNGIAENYYANASSRVAMSVCGPTHTSYRNCCVVCRVKKVKLKDCSRCKSLSYCSVACQKEHWPQHKFACYPLAHRPMVETMPIYF